MKNLKAIHAGVFACFLLLIAGCGAPKVPDAVKETSLSISDKGEVISYLVDEFDKGYYNITDLTSMAMEEAAEYNKEHASGEANPVIVEKVEKPDENENTVVLTQRFINAATYEDYNGELLFWGTVSQALQAGYEISGSMKNVKTGEEISGDWVHQNGDARVIITNAKAVIYPPARVTAISSGTYRENGTVSTVGTEGNIVILLK